MKTTTLIRLAQTLVVALPLFLVACASPDPQVRLAKLRSALHTESGSTSARCKDMLAPLPKLDRPAALNLVSDLTEARCFEEALSLGEALRRTSRDKTYSVTTEILSVFVPEETASDYVMESYERAYLSLLMASIYWSAGLRDEAGVELRQSYHEGRSVLYNYGDDPVNALLLATFWENLESPEDARPFWKRLSEHLPEDDPVGRLARERTSAIDDGESPRRQKWRIVTAGRFPALDWGVGFGKKEGSYYELKYKSDLPPSCSSQSGAVLSTKAWIEKIRLRYTADYHPLLNFKSWVRFPIGIAYGVTTFTAGAGILVGGCVADASMEAKGELCKAAAAGGGYVMAKSGDIVGYALKPDLRHWSRVPAAILITKAPTYSDEPCYKTLPDPLRQNTFSLVD